jgi:hypothetical protein
MENWLRRPFRDDSTIGAARLRTDFSVRDGKFCVPGKLSRPTESAKTLLYEMDLKVAELFLSANAKCLEDKSIRTA